MALSYPQERPSTPSPTSREDSVTPPDYKPQSSPSKMFTIDSILNAPTSAINQPLRSRQLDVGSQTSTSTTSAFTASSVTRSATPVTPLSFKGKKGAKDASILNRNAPNGQVAHLPFELSEPTVCLSNDERKDLGLQHQLFSIKPSEANGGGQIRNNTRHIPYSSEKKNFFSKTGMHGFNLFSYTFRLPHDPGQTEYTVMWDYVNGLTRITPFFKACNHSKTVPAKALSTNPGLKELSHSITGGALAAQGYWVPYACARAVCLTFCYNIRWALTPIFGPSFIRECLPPNHAGYQKFKIDSETVRYATLEAEGWKQSSSHVNSPAEIPRSVPYNNTGAAGGKGPRQRDNRSLFKSGSPFQSGSERSDESDYHGAVRSAAYSPRISPKTSIQETFNSPTWTSINGSARAGTPSTGHTLPNPLTRSLLNQPRQYASWRAADPVQSTATTIPDRRASLRSQQKRNMLKRPRSPSPETAADADYSDDVSEQTVSSSESDDADIVVAPKKRTRRGKANADVVSESSSSAHEQDRTVRFDAQDFRAARLLLAMSQQNDHLTAGPFGPVRKEE